MVRDIVIGMADGLTVPFALAAGLTGAVDRSHIIVVAGLAEIAAGSIAMGLGGYLAARSDEDHYASEHKREELEIIERREDERQEVHEILESYGLEREPRELVLASFERNPATWVDWMMRFELGLEKPQPGRAVRSAGTIAFSYIAGGLIPADALPDHAACAGCVGLLGGRDHLGAGDIWLREGTLHRRLSLEERLPHHAYRRLGGRGCVFDCKAVFGVSGS